MVTLTVEFLETDANKARRLGMSLEGLVIEAMGLTGRRGLIVGMSVEEMVEATS